MANVYSAHNIAAHFIEELNSMHKFINTQTLQHLLAELDNMWHQAFGRSAYYEQATPNNEHYIQSVAKEYNHHANAHIQAPELEWDLEYGAFQLIQRPYPTIAFTEKEKIMIHKAIAKVYSRKQAAIAV